MRCAWQDPGSAGRASRTRRRHQSWRGRSVHRRPGVASALNRTKYTAARRSVPEGPEPPTPKPQVPVRYDAAVSTGRVFRRSTVPDPPVAIEASGSTIRTADGREYLDAAGGAIVVNVGHGRREIAAAMADQAGRLAYAHGSAFTTEPLEAYAREVGAAPAGRRPGDLPGVGRVRGDRDGAQAGPRLPPVARRAGSPHRLRAVGELPRQHARRARPVRAQAAPPPIRGLARPLPARLGRLSLPGGPARRRCAGHGRPNSPTELDRAFEAAGPGTVAAFVAEPIVGATLAAAVPPDGYWPAIAEVCRRHGVLLIADEVMTGFGRTGRWFALDHWGVRPDILVAAKGASSGYWPFGFVAASDEVYATVTRPGVRLHPRLHLLARAGRGRGRARGPAHPRGRIPGRGERGQGRAAGGLSRPRRSARIRPSARSAVAA